MPVKRPQWSGNLHETVATVVHPTVLRLAGRAAAPRAQRNPAFVVRASRSGTASAPVAIRLGPQMGSNLMIDGQNSVRTEVPNVGREPASSPEPANPAMAQAIATARQVATSDVPILITGESGTGKRTLAAAIHRWSDRRSGPFVSVWCEALTPQPLDGGLIDHLRGAFTGGRSAGPDGPAVMDGGTLFLDEVGNGNLPVHFQVKLLRFLEDQRFGRLAESGGAEVDARVIAASTHDLDREVRAGGFRQDLFFRLGVVRVALPPLRERCEDLPRLRDHFLARLAARHWRGELALTPEAERLLDQYDWPGNVTELISVLEGALVRSQGDRVGADEVCASLRVHTDDDAAAHPLSLVEVEQRQIRLALQDCATLAQAAARLGIDPATLWRKRKRYGLDPQARRSEQTRVKSS
jgi:NtrC-family two-component system response regulator AlgB